MPEEEAIKLLPIQVEEVKMRFSIFSIPSCLTQPDASLRKAGNYEKRS